jgi:hypothetical protein
VVAVFTDVESLCFVVAGAGASTEVVVSVLWLVSVLPDVVLVVLLVVVDASFPEVEVSPELAATGAAISTVTPSAVSNALRMCLIKCCILYPVYLILLMYVLLTIANLFNISGCVIVVFVTLYRYGEFFF